MVLEDIHGKIAIDSTTSPRSQLRMELRLTTVPRTVSLPDFTTFYHVLSKLTTKIKKTQWLWISMNSTQSSHLKQKLWSFTLDFRLSLLNISLHTNPPPKWKLHDRVRESELEKQLALYLPVYLLLLAFIIYYLAFLVSFLHVTLYPQCIFSIYVCIIYIYMKFVVVVHFIHKLFTIKFI